MPIAVEGSLTRLVKHLQSKDKTEGNYVVRIRIKEQPALRGAETLHCIALLFTPPASAETVKVVGVLFSHEACLAFLENVNGNFRASKINSCRYLMKQTGRLGLACDLNPYIRVLKERHCCRPI